MRNNANLEFRKIKSLKYLYEVNANGTIFRNVKSKKQLKIKLDMHHSKKGYYTTFVRIGGRRPDAKTIRVMIHKVVAECWLGDCPDGYEVDHIDRNPHNNDYHNLRYVTHSEQMKNRVLGQKIIDRAKLNCLNHSLTVLAKPVQIKKNDELIQFRSMSKCAEYIAQEYNKKPKTIMKKLSDHRRHIYNYDIIYLNAETGHANSTE